MNTLKFKTNINCTGCLSTVKPFLDNKTDIHNWNVNLQHDERILTVQTDRLTADDVEKTVKKAGFDAEEMA